MGAHRTPSLRAARRPGPREDELVAGQSRSQAVADHDLKLANHACHGVNVQVVTDAAGEILRLSPAPPGRTHDLTAAPHKILRICERQGVPILADMAYIGHG